MKWEMRNGTRLSSSALKKTVERWEFLVYSAELLTFVMMARKVFDRFQFISIKSMLNENSGKVENIDIEQWKFFKSKLKCVELYCAQKITGKTAILLNSHNFVELTSSWSVRKKYFILFSRWCLVDASNLNINSIFIPPIWTRAYGKAGAKQWKLKIEFEKTRKNVSSIKATKKNIFNQELNDFLMDTRIADNRSRLLVFVFTSNSIDLISFVRPWLIEKSSLWCVDFISIWMSLNLKRFVFRLFLCWKHKYLFFQVYFNGPPHSIHFNTQYISFIYKFQFHHNSQHFWSLLRHHQQTKSHPWMELKAAKYLNTQWEFERFQNYLEFVIRFQLYDKQLSCVASSAFISD